MTERPPLPPFTLETAIQKVRIAEDAWNTRDPQRVAAAYTSDSRWRNRVEFVQGREAIQQFLTRKWQRELDYRLIKEIWAFRENRIAVRFAYEWHDDSGNWFRSYGNENWEFDELGLMLLRIASINDLPIAERDRKFEWPLGRRPDNHPSLTALNLGGTSLERTMSPVIDLLDGNRHGLRVTLMAPMVLNARNGEAGSAGENGRPASRATRCGRGGEAAGGSTAPRRSIAV